MTKLSQDTDLRAQRKAEHLEAVRTLRDGAREESWFRDLVLLPNCAPEVSHSEVAIDTRLCGIRVDSPIVINAMTGGTDEALTINRRLARLARRHGLAMAVGSETAALSDPRWEKTFTVVREENPDGVVIANVGMGTAPQAAQAAVQMLRADILQVHWNVAQELFMEEGDRDFRGALEQLAKTVDLLAVPVIAKEVGQGVAAPEARLFMQAGVSGIDIGGRGGTNFIAVEAWRRNQALDEEWQEWGIPTPAALCEVVQAVGGAVDVVASGGVRSGHDVAKAMAVGACAVGIASPFLRLVSQPDGEAAADALVDSLHATLRKLLVLTGSRNWVELRNRPVIVRGRVREWLVARGLEAFAMELGSRNQTQTGLQTRLTVLS